MIVKVKYYGVVKDIIKEPTAEFELPDGASVADLLEMMGRTYGPEFVQRVMDDRVGVRTYVRLFLNDEEVEGKEIKATRLSAAGGDAEATLYIMPSSTGGTRPGNTPVIDSHVHYTPPQMMGGSQERVVLKDEHGVPTYILHPRLGDLGLHVEEMDRAGVDLAVLSSGAGMMGDLNDCRLVNNCIRQSVQEYSGRFAGLAHIPPLGGEAAWRELERASGDLGFTGVAMQSDIDGLTLDRRELWPFYERVQELGLFIFVHPSLKTLGSEFMQDFDLARSVGREFGLVMATIRLINGGVLDDFPGLRVQMSHLGGGIAALLGRVRSYQDKDFWGTADDERHGKLPRRPFDEYLSQIYFDTGGFCGNLNAVKSALLELRPSQILFGTDYPQEIRTGQDVGDFLEGIRGLGISQTEIGGILGQNGGGLLGI